MIGTGGGCAIRLSPRRWHRPAGRLVAIGRTPCRCRPSRSGDPRFTWLRFGPTYGGPNATPREPPMFKFLGKTAGIIFLIGLAVVIGLLMLIF